MKNRKLLTIVFLSAILIIAVFFRLWQLNKIPPGLYPDVAINGTDALDTLANNDFKLFYPENNGREGLFMWIIALSFLLFGPSVWAIKIVAAVIGILTVIGVYLLAKELFAGRNKERRILNPEAVALLSAFFLAISFWHTNFSRLGFRAIMVPFFLAFGFYWFLRGFRKEKVVYMIFSGIFFGLGFYTYISYRFVILILATALIAQWFIRKKGKERKDFLKLAGIGLTATLIVALPIGIYFLLNPGDFFGRAGGVSVFGHPDILKEFAKSIILHLGMFNIHGDGNWRHNYANSPVLLWPVGILFIVGLIFSIKELIISLKQKDVLRSAPYLLLFSWFFSMLLPGFLSSEGAPHALRTIGVIPVVYIFSGLGAVFIFGKIKTFFQTKFQIVALYSCLFLLLASIGFSEFNKYFYYWAGNKNVEGAFSKNYLEIGEYLNSLPRDVEKYVIVNAGGVPVPLSNGLPMPAQTPIFIERSVYGKTRSVYLLPGDLNKINPQGDAVIIPLLYEGGLFNELFALFPWGKIVQDNNVWLFKI